MASRVYIDGHVGTVGLRIRELLAPRRDLEVLTLPEARRKDPGARREALSACEVAVLCLPDDVAREVAGWGAAARLLDASTAHRVADGWTYGLAELQAGSRRAIAAAERVSNPGCYALGAILLVRPLVDAGLLPHEAPVVVHGLSGYTGGGRSLIERWEDPGLDLLSLRHAAPYALDRVHKHIPEMRRHAGLEREPQLVPAVGPFACGMRIQIPLHAELLPATSTAKALFEALDARYRGEAFVQVIPVAESQPSDERRFDPQRCNDTNRIELRVLPHPSGHVLLMAILDNLGKGAAGNAVQNLNLMLGLAESAGL